MIALTSADQDRLAKLLAMLGSDQPGERDAAGLAANRLVQKLGATWQAVLQPPPVERRLPEIGTWRQTVTRCLQRPHSLRPWEAVFLRDLPNFRRLSVKQRYILKEIAGRVLEEGRR